MKSKHMGSNTEIPSFELRLAEVKEMASQIFGVLFSLQSKFYERTEAWLDVRFTWLESRDFQKTIVFMKVALDEQQDSMMDASYRYARRLISAVTLMNDVEFDNWQGASELDRLVWLAQAECAVEDLKAELAKMVEGSVDQVLLSIR